MSGINDFVVKFATVNGSGSASANGIFAKTLFRMGIPVSPKNIFPSNIQGLPTWYEVRVSEAGYLARRDGIDLMVAMNPQSYKEDLAEIVPGGWLLLRFDPAPRLAARRHQGARHSHRRDVRQEVERPAPAPAVQEHGLRRRADGAARHRSRGPEDDGRRPAQGQGKARRRQHGGGGAGPRVRGAAISIARCPFACARRRAPRARSWCRATTPPASAPSTRAPRCAPGIRSRRRPRWRRRTRNMPSACAWRRTAGASTASSRRRTSLPPSALPSAAAGTGRARSPPPRDRASR